MARPPTIRDEDLLQAVHDVVRERGATATTAEVAERAGDRLAHASPQDLIGQGVDVGVVVRAEARSWALRMISIGSTSSSF